jgi:hypothetical protein
MSQRRDPLHNLTRIFRSGSEKTKRNEKSGRKQGQEKIRTGIAFRLVAVPRCGLGLFILGSRVRVPPLLLAKKASNPRVSSGISGFLLWHDAPPSCLLQRIIQPTFVRKSTAYRSQRREDAEEAYWTSNTQSPTSQESLRLCDSARASAAICLFPSNRNDPNRTQKDGTGVCFPCHQNLEGEVLWKIDLGLGC